MKFTHIHCSSRFSRPTSSLETASDVFYKTADIVTWTEVGKPSRTPALAEKGWGYFNAVSTQPGYDECAVSWDLSVFTKQKTMLKKLSGRWRTATGGWRWPMVACTVLLKHRTTGHLILVSVVHMPNKIGGPSGFRAQGQGFAQRKESYITATKNWNAHIADLERKWRPDGVIIAADWNINFRLGWARQYVNSHFKQSGLAQSWKHFTSAGTFGRSVIDASLYSTSGLVSDGAFVIKDPADSTDHTPFKQVFTTKNKAKTPVKPSTTPTKPAGQEPDDEVEGGGGTGVEWWNFEDYADDTIYVVEPA